MIQRVSAVLIILLLLTACTVAPSCIDDNYCDGNEKNLGECDDCLNLGDPSGDIEGDIELQDRYRPNEVFTIQ